MDRRNQRTAVIVHWLPLEHLIEEFPARPSVIERLIDGCVRYRLIVFRAHEVARKIAEALTIEDLAAQSGSLRRGGRGRAGAELVAECAQACVDPDRSRG